MKTRPTTQWEKGKVHKEFTEKEIQKALKCMKECSASFIIRKMQIIAMLKKTFFIYHYGKYPKI